MFSVAPFIILCYSLCIHLVHCLFTKIATNFKQLLQAIGIFTPYNLIKVRKTTNLLFRHSYPGKSLLRNFQITK